MKKARHHIYSIRGINSAPAHNDSPAKTFVFNHSLRWVWYFRRKWGLWEDETQYVAIFNKTNLKPQRQYRRDMWKSMDRKKNSRFGNSHIPNPAWKSKAERPGTMSGERCDTPDRFWRIPSSSVPSAPAAPILYSFAVEGNPSILGLATSYSATFLQLLRFSATFTVKLRKPWTNEKFQESVLIVCWPVTENFRTRKQTKKPQTVITVAVGVLVIV